MHFDSTINFGLFGLFLGLLLIYEITGAYQVSKRWQGFTFIEPVALFLATLVVIIDAVLGIFAGRFVISLIAVVVFLVIAPSEALSKWKSARNTYKWSQDGDAKEYTTWIQQFWDRFEEWWNRYLDWRENAEERRLVAQEEARIRAQQELANEAEATGEIEEKTRADLESQTENEP